MWSRQQDERSSNGRKWLHIKKSISTCVFKHFCSFANNVVEKIICQSTSLGAKIFPLCKLTLSNVEDVKRQKKSVMKGLKSHGVGCNYTNSIEQGKRFECQQWHCYKYQAWATKCQGVSNHTPIGYEICNVLHPFKQSHKHMEGGMGYKIGKKEGWGGKKN